MKTDVLLSHSTDLERGDFYKKTYIHVAFAILVFAGLEAFLLNVVPAELIFMMIGQKYSWLLVLGVFWLGSFMATKWSLSQSRATQYVGLGLSVLLYALIFLPMIYMALLQDGTGNLLLQAASLTVAMFAGISLVAFTSKRDFSFLRNIITIGGFIALGLIVAGMIFGFNLGL